MGGENTALMQLREQLVRGVCEGCQGVRVQHGAPVCGKRRGDQITGFLPDPKPRTQADRVQAIIFQQRG